MSTPGSPAVQVSADADELARTVAQALAGRIAALQVDGRVPSVVLTGGSIAERLHRAVLETDQVDAVDWSRVEIWYGDERFVPGDDPDRNALQARQALLDHVPLDPSRVHEMPASDGACGDDVDAAAAFYADELSRVLGDEPRFDLLMLGIGPDGHCASLFPGRDEVHAAGLTVPVLSSPKPPPTRISLTMEQLNRADEVWFVAAGETKAEAVHNALTATDVTQVPSSGPRGRRATTFWLDAAAASRLPEGLRTG